jgi:hypothetical protein
VGEKHKKREGREGAKERVEFESRESGAMRHPLGNRFKPFKVGVHDERSKERRRKTRRRRRRVGTQRGRKRRGCLPSVKNYSASAILADT